MKRGFMKGFVMKIVLFSSMLAGVAQATESEGEKTRSGSG